MTEPNDYAHALVFICLTMLFVIGVYELRKCIKFPASFLLVLSGIFLRHAGVFIGDIEGSVKMWSKVDEWSVLLLFLPALIFECGFSIDWYAFKREIYQILLMSTTAVVMHSILVAVTLKYILLIDMNWDEAYLIGVILSATDHVTVVSQIKELKVGKAFETLIQGETLLIDGSVMVLFFVMIKRLTGEDVETSETIVHFLRLSFGGFALGICFCVVFTMVIKRIINDEVSEVNMTIVTTYLIFFTAEDSGIEVSGAISTVTFGLFMAAYGKTLISPSVEHSLHVFWRIITRNIEGIIFVLSGMVIAGITLNAKFGSVSLVWKTLVLFVFLHILRLIVVFIHYPILRKLGLGLHWKDAVLLSIAGAKGVISTSLAIFVWRNDEVSENYRTVTLFIVVMCSSLSVCCDSFIVRLVTRYLGTGEYSEAMEHSLLQVTHGILKANQKLAEELSKQYLMVQWDAADRFSSTRKLVEKVMQTSQRGKDMLTSNPSLSEEELIDLYFNSTQLDDDKLLSEVRRRCLLAIKGLCWELFERGLCQGSNALILIESADFCLEKFDEPVVGWEFLLNNAFNSTIMKVLKKLSKTWLFGKAFHQLHFAYLADIYDIASGFIHVHREVLEAIERMLSSIDPRLVKRIYDEFEEQLHLAEEYRDSYVKHDFSEVVSYMQTRQVSYCMLNNQRRLIGNYFKKGLVDPYEKEMLTEVINRNYKLLTLSHSHELPEFNQLLKTSPLVEGLTAEESLTLIKRCKAISFQKGEVIFREMTKAKGAYFILKGKAKETSETWTSYLKSGNAVGELSLLQECSKTTTSAKAKTPVLAAFLPKSKDVLEMISLHCLKALAVKKLATFTELNDPNLTGLKLKTYAKVAELSIIRRYERGDTLSFTTGGFLVYGVLGPEHNKKLYFPADNSWTEVKQPAAFLHFCTDLTIALLINEGSLNKAVKSLRSSFAVQPSKPEVYLDTATDEQRTFTGEYWEKSDRTFQSESPLQA